MQTLDPIKWGIWLSEQQKNSGTLQKVNKIYSKSGQKEDSNRGGDTDDTYDNYDNEDNGEQEFDDETDNEALQVNCEE